MSTHNSALSRHQVEIEGIVNALQKASLSIFPNDGERLIYEHVDVIAISWDKCPLYVGSEISDLLDVLGDHYHFEVDAAKLSGNNPRLQLQSLLSVFLLRNDAVEPLKIVIYSGHGGKNDAGDALWGR